MYKKITNPTEEEVSKLLQEGYQLHSITPLMIGLQYGYDLIYHFVKELYLEPNDTSTNYYIGVDLFKNGTPIDFPE